MTKVTITMIIYNQKIIALKLNVKSIVIKSLQFKEFNIYLRFK